MRCFFCVEATAGWQGRGGAGSMSSAPSPEISCIVIFLHGLLCPFSQDVLEAVSVAIRRVSYRLISDLSDVSRGDECPVM